MTTATRRSAYSAQDILRQLDEAAEELFFPMLDNGYYYPVDGRLHAFGDDERWALVIETVGYNPRGQNLFDVLDVYGNCASGRTHAENQDLVARIDNWDDIDAAETWREGASAVVVRGREIAVDAEPGTPLEDVFRSLVPEHRDLLLATEGELRRKIAADVPRVLQLEEWNHPDVAGDELPSRSPTFQQIAEVLATGDVTRYRPSDPPNTHWSHWPAGGTL